MWLCRSKLNIGMEEGGYAVDSSLNAQDLKFCTVRPRLFLLSFCPD
jgi:hypothetical protein